MNTIKIYTNLNLNAKLVELTNPKNYKLQKYIGF